ncbi:sirohydrochlorin cobaltochelatase [Eggerthellaceae bacterium zg-997]|nr:sirohydrochlorin cobaltochelatase [Eggerthellaceae bacterium zg-997]
MGEGVAAEGGRHIETSAGPRIEQRVARRVGQHAGRGLDSAVGEDVEQMAEEATARLAAQMEQDGALNVPAVPGSRPVMVVASFGTSYPDSRRAAIGGVEAALAAAFPAWEVRRAFTARKVIAAIERREGRRVPTVGEALSACAEQGVREVCVVSTHLIPGREYADVRTAVEAARGLFERVCMTGPLLDSDDDVDCVVDACVRSMMALDDGASAFCLMGHGTYVEADRLYDRVAAALCCEGRRDCFLGTVEGRITLRDAADAIWRAGYRRAVLRPLMLVAGDHAHNDMADASDPESLAGLLAARGIEPVCVVEGLGQLPAVRARYVGHAHAALAGA